MTEKELKFRTRKFTADILNFVAKLPNRPGANLIGNQLGRCASSVAANYGATCKEHAEFVKTGVVKKEADESTFWLHIIPGTKNNSKEVITSLLNEARELTAILTGACKTAKQNKSK